MGDERVGRVFATQKILSPLCARTCNGNSLVEDPISEGRRIAESAEEKWGWVPMTYSVSEEGPVYQCDQL